MATTTTIEGTKATIAISGWLDTGSAPDLEKALAELDPSCTELVIDLAELEYISSAGLRQLVVAHRKSRGEYYNIALDLIDSGFEFFAGGGVRRLPGIRRHAVPFAHWIHAGTISRVSCRLVLLDHDEGYCPST